ncbi:LOW QUALITY PROTEIN: hypothetical protein MXB_933, partial [Myxobolus squamalis]
FESKETRIKVTKAILYQLRTAVTKKMTMAFEKRLEFEKKDSYRYSFLKIKLTYLSNTINVSEVRCFYTIDLGRTNMRLLIISIIDDILIPESTSFTVHTVAFLGSTFSFPVNQLALNRGFLICSTKGYNPSEVEKVILINDTTVTLPNDALEKSETKIGDIVVTNTNAC